MIRQRIGTIRGVSVEIGLLGIAVCFLLFGAVDVAFLREGSAAASRILVLLTGQVSILLVVSIGHELGHVVVWRLLGVTVHRCELHGLWAKTVRGSAQGVSRPGQILAVAAGPLVNIALALLVVPVLSLPMPLLWATLAQYGFLGNLSVGITNLVPLGRLDGARILRLFLQR